MINISGNINELYVGSTPIEKAYIGSQLVWEKTSLPYDAEIQYLQSTGTQYIDTLIPYNSSVEIEARMMRTTSASGGYAWGIYYWSSRNKAYRWSLNFGSNTVVKPHFGTVTNVNATMSRNAWHIVKANYRYLWIDDTVTDSKAAAFTTESKVVNVGIFSRLGAINQAAVYFSYFKLWKGGVLVRDYIPVRVGQVGYMYDRVSGELFGNSGTGSFTLGPDVT